MSWAALTDALAGALRDERDAWTVLFREPEKSLLAASTHGVTHLLSRHAGSERLGIKCPANWDGDLQRDRRAAVATEMCVAADLKRVLDALAGAGVSPILFKGAALAYSVYDSPELRPRSDCDFFIREEHASTVRQVLEAHGFTAALSCEQLFGQVRFDRSTALGVNHAIDVHWRISTQTLFADLVTYDELASSSIALPSLSACARAAGFEHALLLACVHPVMHHRNEELLIWMYDVHVLASRLTAEHWQRFVRLAVARGVSAICSRQLGVARSRFHSAIPEWVLSELSSETGFEAAAAYLAPGRRWHHELRDNVRHAGTWNARLQVLRDVLLPDRDYMRRRYGITAERWGTWLLPLLHMHRLAHGAGKMLSGRK